MGFSRSFPINFLDRGLLPFPTEVGRGESFVRERRWQQDFVVRFRGLRRDHLIGSAALLCVLFRTGEETLAHNGVSPLVPIRGHC